jgi:hypothetical protein
LLIGFSVCIACLAKWGWNWDIIAWAVVGTFVLGIFLAAFMADRAGASQRKKAEAVDPDLAGCPV